jgi:catechol 2,3-dioxygenase-like lactoylglutathione lyase family enzyme
MKPINFEALHPIIGTRDIEEAIEFYTTRLGFELTFRDGSTPTNYAGLRRGPVELHMQFQYPHEMSTIRLRFRVSGPDALLAEYKSTNVEIANDIKDTPWGTREFALYDLDRNALTFYSATNLEPSK